MVEQVFDAPQIWSYTDENLALLVDRLDYWLGTEYAGWVTDPNDPEVKRERAERKRSGVKPSPIPIIPPVAKRPPEQDKQARDIVERMRALYSGGLTPTGSKIDALDALLG